MRFKYAAAAAVSVALLAGCSSTTGGSPQPAGVAASSTATRSATTTTTTAEAARTPVTIEGDTGDYLDRLAQNTLDSLVTFWDGQGKVTDSVRYVFWESGKGETSPTCSHETFEDGMFCDYTKGKKTDVLAWDKTYFGTVVNDPKVGAKAAPVLILAHEYGHAVQAATGHYKDNPNRELEADCLAGVFAKNTVPEVTDSEWAGATFVVYRDPSNPSDMDKMTSRTAAFTTGRVSGSFDTCMSYTG